MATFTDPTSSNESNSSTPRILRPLTGFGSRAAESALRPIGGVLNAVAEAGMDMERRAVDHVLASEELERVLTATIESEQVQAAVIGALSSDAAKRIVDAAFDSGLVDRVVDRLLTSRAVWHLIDEVAASPAVTAAISNQGLGFAGQTGDEVREGAQKVDDRGERSARWLIHRSPRPLSVGPDKSI